MNNKSVNEAIETLCRMRFNLEQTFVENEGECTEETDEMERQIEAFRTLLTTEGIDSLGHWLNALDDEKKSLKNEKDYLTRKINAVDNTIEYVKSQINRIMTETGVEKVKGSLGYSFTPTTSVTTTIDKDTLKLLYEEKVQGALTAAHIPCYITFTLNASATKAKEFGILSEGDEEIFHTTEKPSVRFTKPRAKKGEE